MKSLLITLLTALSAVVSAQTNISGLISSNTTWIPTGNPYIITGNAVLAQGATLTIEPGVVVRFNQGTAFAILGELQAIGTEQDSIVFTSNAQTPSPMDYKGIMFYNESLDYNSNNQSGCILKYCVIEYAGSNSGSLGDGAINIDRSSPSIQNSTLRYNGIGIYTEGQGNYICYIKGNNIYYNVGSGIFLDVSWEAGNGYGPAHIIGNKISNNGIGVSVNWSTVNTLIENNIIASNTNFGIYSGFSSTSIQRNVIHGNRGAIYADTFNGGAVSISNNLIVNNTSICETFDFGCEDGPAVLGFGYISNFAGNQLVDNYFTNYLIKFNEFSIAPPAVENNTIVRNNCVDLLPQVLPSVGIILRMKAVLNVSHNNIEGNQLGLPTRSIMSADNLNATGNYWGTSNDMEIQEQVFDFFDSTALGIISYVPYNGSPVIAAPMTPPLNVRKVDLGNGSVKLCWSSNLETDIAGYKVYFGSPTGYSFSDFVNVGNVNTYVLNGASINDSIAITAYDNLADNFIDNFEDMFDGNESWFTYAEDVTLNPDFSTSSNNLFVDFENLSNNATSIAWDFGDGHISNEENPQHEYAGPGTYEVCLTVENDCASAETVCQHIAVTCPAPVSDFSYIENELEVSFTNQSSNANSFEWYFGDGSGSSNENPMYSFNTAGVHEVCLVSVNGCGTDTVCQQIDVSCTEYFNLFFTGNLLFCDGDSILLNAPTGQVGYEWSSGEAEPAIYVTQSGTYYATAVSVPQGCELYSDTVMVDVVVLTPVISDNGTSLVTDTYASYQWLADGNEIQGANSQTFAPEIAGDYQVMVSDGNGCSAISDPFSFTPLNVGLIESNEYMIGVYPNPTSGVFRLQMQETKPYSVEVFNSLGQLVLTQSHKPNDVASIELTSVGVYHLRIFIGGAIHVLKVVKK